MTCLPFQTVSGYKLYSGPNPIYNPDILKEKQIKTAAVLLPELECSQLPSFYKVRDIAQISCPIPDFATPSTTKKAYDFVEAIFKALETGNVYLHCYAGRGRTGLITACIFILKEEKSSSEAVIATRTLVPGSIQRLTQELFVHQFAKDYGKKQETEANFLNKIPKSKLPKERGLFEKWTSHPPNGNAFSLDLPNVPSMRALMPNPERKKKPDFILLPFQSQAGYNLYTGPVTAGELAYLERYNIATSVVLSKVEALLSKINRLSLQDFDFSSSPAKVLDFVEKIFKALEKGDVYLHQPLKAKVIIACCAIAKQQATAQEAIALVEKHIGRTIEASEEKFIRQFYVYVHQRYASFIHLLALGHAIDF